MAWDNIEAGDTGLSVRTRLNALGAQVDDVVDDVATAVGAVKIAPVVGDGATSDSAIIQAAVDSLGPLGGTVLIPNGKRCLIDTNITLHANVSLCGPHQFIGSPQNNLSAPYGSMGGALIVNPAATITLGGGASLKGLLIHRKGMTFPANDASAFAGTAITGNGDDITISHCLVLGFAQAYTSTSAQRPHIDNLKFDCLNGILIHNCADIAYVTQCHGWPFATIASTAELPGQLKRSGTGIKMTGIGDWNKITNCFTYGYFRGFNINGCENVTLIGCGADNTPASNPHTNAIGFLIDGQSNDTRLIGCQAAANTHGLYVATAAGKRTRVDNFDSWFSLANGIVADTGDVSIEGGIIRDTNNGVLIISSTANVFVDKVRFHNIGGSAIIATSATDRLRIGPHNDYGNLATSTGASVGIPPVPSATNLALPFTGDMFTVTGTTTIATLAEGWAGRQVTLLFASAVTVTHGTSGSTAMRLANAANFAAPAGGTLTLRHNGGQWFEVGRCA